MITPKESACWSVGRASWADEEKAHDGVSVVIDGHGIMITPSDARFMASLLLLSAENAEREEGGS
ncbi:MAG: hypothetical protein QM777_08725 [Pseudorhodoferax sp.]